LQPEFKGAATAANGQSVVTETKKARGDGTPRHLENLASAGIFVVGRTGSDRPKHPFPGRISSFEHADQRSDAVLAG